MANLYYSPSPCFSRTCHPSPTTVPKDYHRSIHFSPSSVGSMSPRGLIPTFPSGHTSWSQGTGPRRTPGPAVPVSSLEFVITVRFASLKVWALKLKPQKLSVASSITFDKKSNGIWFVRREKEGQCRCAGWQNWGEITSSHEFVILVFLGTYLQIHLCILWETSIALQ